MMARETILASALMSERERMATANDVLRDVLMNHRASDEVRSAASTLIEWLTTPAEKIAVSLADKQRECTHPLDVQPDGSLRCDRCNLIITR